MGKRIVITEEQYRKALQEGVNPTNVTITPQGGETLDSAAKRTAKDLKTKGLDPNDPSKNTTLTVDPQAVGESKTFVTKKQLKEDCLNALKEDSKLYTVESFFRSVRNK